MNPLDELPTRLVRAQTEGKLHWTTLEGPFGGSYLCTDKRERITFYLMPSRRGLLRKKLDAYLTVYHNSHKIREYTGDVVANLYTLVHLDADPVRERDQRERETAANTALEHLLD